ncbi:GNAT family N-acetyltransferase [Shewanella cyperi]|uniref:GNAT family N-acetyltransferase n=1 Tax=Shewanella cyperi TaxID=2814292 RepID=UPI001A9435D1|nr:GNAT family N-acetyltransferase [Shewanella cyperi]QSX40773.1 GNAT family N-acetyltransferase [Shewanella cyperi]
MNQASMNQPAMSQAAIDQAARVVVATSPRLSLSHFAPGDAADFFALNADPQVLQYTGDLPFADPAAALAFIHNYDHYQRHGFGRWSLHLHDGTFIGFCGLKQHGDGQVDLGFRLARAYWGKGLAGEAARAAMVLAKDRFELDSLIARAMADNQDSIHLLNKLGFGRAGKLDQGQWLGFELSLSEVPLERWRRDVQIKPYS